MTERTRRRWSAALGIKLILGVQIAIAAILLASDIARVLPRAALLSPDAPRLTQPVEPGDQTRRYDRRRVPTGPGVPGTSDMPSRLLFEVDGDTLTLTGAIADGDADRFTDWLAARPLPATIALHSTGGSVTDALAIGDRLRAGGATTEVRQGQVCLSACPYILAAGTERRVHEEAYVGVHQHYFGENTALPAFLAVEDIQRGQGEVLVYLDTMGIDLRLMQHALSTPPEDIYILLPNELERYALATEITG
ncbi:MAG: hypothetical protein QNJ44_14335 [Rhodobacter sp.]|nr:hypothetical protein [Rhodobacter sp.]